MIFLFINTEGTFIILKAIVELTLFFIDISNVLQCIRAVDRIFSIILHFINIQRMVIILKGFIQLLQMFVDQPNAIESNCILNWCFSFHFLINH